MDRNNEADKWFKKAEGDLLNAENTFKQKILPRIITFHCHQALEKYLKGLQIIFLGDYEKVHDLAILADSLKSDVDLIGFRKNLIFLSSFYIQGRYPSEKETEVSIQKADNVLKMTKNILNILKKYQGGKN